MENLAITTVNVNGIRAAYKRGMGQWLEEIEPHVVLMQEVRASEEIAKDLMGERYRTIIHPSQIKGRAGVGIALRKDHDLFDADGDVGVQVGLSPEQSDLDSGRWVEATIDVGFPLRLVSTYFHSGQLGTPKQDAKMAHLPQVETRLKQLRAEADSGQQAIVAGDFNVVRGELDIKNWKGNYNKSSGVLDEEMEFLNRWTTQGWVDVVRELAGQRQGPYSWWSWRGQAYDRDTGWRIDYQYATEELSRRATSWDIYRAPTWDTRFSDHAPVTVKYELS